jgi:hypothetical protein
MDKKTTKDWLDEINKDMHLSVDVNTSPCGWDLDNFNYSFHEEEITLKEFKERLKKSIVECNIVDIDRFMKDLFTINNIEVYKDGGTIKVETNKGDFYIDRRLRSETKGFVFDGYPGKEGKMLTGGSSIKNRLYHSLKDYEHPFYTNIQSIRDDILR